MSKHLQVIKHGQKVWPPRDRERSRESDLYKYLSIQYTELEALTSRTQTVPDAFLWQTH